MLILKGKANRRRKEDRNGRLRQDGKRQEPNGTGRVRGC